MKRVARSSFLIAVFFLLSMAAQATSSLAFEGGGYFLDLEIGDTDRPVVASVGFLKEGDAERVVLRGNFHVEVFDTARKDLILVYEGGDSRVVPFRLTVHEERATLEVAGERIDADFSWVM